MDDQNFLPDFRSIAPLLLLVIFSQLLSIVIVISRYPISPFPWQPLSLYSLTIQWITLSTASTWCLLRTVLQNSRPLFAIAAYYSTILLTTLTISFAGQWIIGMNQTSAPPLGASLEHTLLFWWENTSIDWPEIIRHLVIAGIIGAMILRYFYLSYQLENQRQAELVHRIQALQSRIQPHFLFNSMNIIASLIESDPETAETVVEDLSDVFRASLNEGLETTTLGQEIVLCKSYLNIEQLRLGERLKVQWEIQPSLPQNLSIPLLTLQPLIENAICHGIQRLAEGGTIHIQILMDKKKLLIKVTNPYPQMKVTHKPTAEIVHPIATGNQIALDNIRNRLKAVFGPSSVVKTKQSSDYFETIIEFPTELKNLQRLG